MPHPDPGSAPPPSVDWPQVLLGGRPTAAWATDEAGRYVYLSPGFAAREGADPDAWLGRTDYEVRQGEDARRVRVRDLLALSGGQPVESEDEVRAADGTVTRWREVRFAYTDPAGRRFVGGVAVPVSDPDRGPEVVTVCAWTTRVKLDGRWVSVGEYLRDRFGLTVTHGISDDALHRAMAQIPLPQKPPG